VLESLGALSAHVENPMENTVNTSVGWGIKHEFRSGSGHIGPVLSERTGWVSSRGSTQADTQWAGDQCAKNQFTNKFSKCEFWVGYMVQFLSKVEDIGSR